VEGARLEWAVKTDAQFRSIEALEGMVVAHRGGAPVHLRDVARVEDGIEDVRSLTRFNGKPGIVIGVAKQSPRVSRSPTAAATSTSRCRSERP
jgi:HAE1 family hydrophobic/amphiphilic exporter-1